MESHQLTVSMEAFTSLEKRTIENRYILKNLLFIVTLAKTPILHSDWIKIVWSRHYLPRFAVILWFVFWKRMSTLDKLAQWSFIDTDVLRLCGRNTEAFSSLVHTPKKCGGSTEATKCKDFLFFLGGLQSWLLTTRWL